MNSFQAFKSILIWKSVTEHRQQKLVHWWHKIGSENWFAGDIEFDSENWFAGNTLINNVNLFVGDTEINNENWFVGDT